LNNGQKFTNKIKQIKTSKDDIVEYLFNSRVIDRIFLEVCSPCQYNCKNCYHSSFRAAYKNYHMTTHELNKFLYYTEKSNYYIREVCLHGPGEPTLWRYLNEGIKILYDSGVIGGIYIISNGVSLDRIEEETFDYIDRIRISMYPDVKNNNYIEYLHKKFPEKIKFEYIKKFTEFPIKKYSDSIPCRCLCPIPMFVKDKIFYCNAGVFGAAALKGVNILDCYEVYSELKENYLHGENNGNYDLCQYCCFNNNIERHLKSYCHQFN